MSLCFVETEVQNLDLVACVNYISVEVPTQKLPDYVCGAHILHHVQMRH